MAVTVADAQHPMRKRRTRLQETLHQMRKEWSAYLFLSPGLLLYAIFTLFSVGFAFYISFHQWNILEPDKLFVGLDNYARLFADRKFHQAVWVTFLFTAAGVPLVLGTGLGLALLLNINIRGRAIFRTLYYIPTITPLVVSSIIWKWLYQGDYGLINYYLIKLGLIQEKLLWLSDPDLAMPALILMGIWAGAGGPMIIYLAGLQSIAEEFYDAAKVDGASAWQRLIYITIPLLAPTTFFLFTTTVIGSFQAFTQIFIMTGGGPLRRTTTVGYYLYEKAFLNFDMGYATAMAFALFGMIFVFTLIQMRFTRGDIQY